MIGALACMALMGMAVSDAPERSTPLRSGIFAQPCTYPPRLRVSPSGQPNPPYPPFMNCVQCGGPRQYQGEEVCAYCAVPHKSVDPRGREPDTIMK